MVMAGLAKSLMVGFIPKRGHGCLCAESCGQQLHWQSATRCLFKWFIARVAA